MFRNRPSVHPQYSYGIKIIILYIEIHNPKYKDNTYDLDVKWLFLYMYNPLDVEHSWILIKYSICS